MLIDGKKIAEELQEEYRQAVNAVTGRRPCLTVILVGDDPASHVYVGSKARACEKVGIISKRIDLHESVSEEALLREIDRLNDDADVDGILVQLPLPKHINENSVIHRIDPSKDVDGFHPVNMGKLFAGENDGFVSCTPLGVMVLLERSGITIEGKHAVIVGRSNIVGKPMAALLLRRGKLGNATVTIAHSHTANLGEVCRQGDLVIAAIGKPQMITADMVKAGAVVIDVGINRIDDPTRERGYRLVGDVDFDGVKDKCSFITPVPKGVGPMTITMLLHNTLKSYRRRFPSCIGSFRSY
ncbi:MAG: bifunctional methylenetetrahydrofolate dehydrogenase/methenyltetrahydrofolate cyclohydrolase FolD [Chlamydiales bacterium]|nr:bifunctional methylenetetrahydrofolate dehydrogenase/methenyltetrahydrofolate cyclohydrolase FolD [Chlamydiia bacterium]MCP5508112.1 bifunctional methylenetetrahydrofolate dehydrogenase/methenyltetrahydrofolate cyclohydrolase FolD [Chlamydiales bacterium]